MKVLTLYYSYTGNTKKIAEMLRKKVGGDIAQIDTVTPYADDYDTVVSQAQREINMGYTPKLKPLHVNLDDYDTILLGTPVWWYTFAPAIKTFLMQNHLTGKSLYAFITDGGWIGHTVEDIVSHSKGAKLKSFIDIKFNGEDLAIPESDILRWADGIQ